MKIRDNILRNASFLCGLIFLMAIGATGVKADPILLYSNGPDLGVNSWTLWRLSGNPHVTDSFELSSRSLLTAVTFSSWAAPHDAPTAVDWAITPTPFGTPIASGTAGLSSSFTGNFGPVTGPGLGYAIWDSSFLLPKLRLDAGTYWLELSNLINPGGDGYWGESSGPSLAYSSAFGQIPSESFQIYSNVPEPSTWLLFGSGIFALTWWRRQAHSRQAA